MQIKRAFLNKKNGKKQPILWVFINNNNGLEYYIPLLNLCVK